VNPTLLALFICLAAATLEGALAGSGVRQRLAELRMPRYSPPFALWIAIGIAYYAICFVVLRRLLTRPSFTPTVVAAITLLLLVLLVNALWNVLFFRWRNLRASFVVFIPYALLVISLGACLFRTDRFGAALFLGYSLYLLYATWWAYRLWLLNKAHD
jgi:tryptophan-rich sensory protein